MLIKGETSEGGRSLWELCIICSTFYKSETTLNKKAYYFFIKNSDNIKRRWRYGETEPLIHRCVGCKVLQPLWKSSAVSENVKHRIHDPAGLLLSMHPEQMRPVSLQRLVPSADSVIHNCQKVGTPHCPSTDEWMNEMQCIHTKEYHLVIKTNALLTQAATWMDIKDTLGEAADRKEHTVYDLIYMKCPEEANPERPKVDQWCQGLRLGRGNAVNRPKISFWGDRNVLKWYRDCGLTL